MTVIRRTNPLGELIALRQAATQIAASLSRRPLRLAADKQPIAVEDVQVRLKARGDAQADRSSSVRQGT